MTLILHITQRQAWEQAKVLQTYQADSLKSEGFIHCSTLQQIVKVANKFFAHEKGLILLCIDSDKVESEILYEAVDGDYFPHLYGRLNIDAVSQVLAFEPNEEGKFELPEALRSII